MCINTKQLIRDSKAIYINGKIMNQNKDLVIGLIRKNAWSYSKHTIVQAKKKEIQSHINCDWVKEALGGMNV